MPRIAQYLNTLNKTAKLKVNISLLLLEVLGHLIVWNLPMASYLYIQKLNEISEVSCSIPHRERKKRKLDINFLYLGV